MNLKIWEDVREVPSEAKKPITGGRLRGMTDINPMWRLKTLTRLFGPCGKGWYYEIVDKQILDGADGKVAFVDINLYVKFDNEWSKPIPGTGGSSFVTKERNGLYTSDECYKMALTDAISVACKALGIGADVYFASDTTKYSTTREPVSASQAKPKKDIASQAQLAKIYALAGSLEIPAEEMRTLLHQKYKVESSKDLTKKQASEMIERLEGYQEGR